MSHDNSHNSSDMMRNLLIAGAVFLTVMYLGGLIMPPAKQNPANDNGATTGSATTPYDSAPTNGAQGSPAAPQMSSGTANGTTTQGGPETVGGSRESITGLVPVQADEEVVLVMGNTSPVDERNHKPGDSPYRARLELTNVGAAVRSAYMTDYAQELESTEPYRFLHPIERPDGRTFMSMAVDRVDVDGLSVPLAHVRWQAEPVTEDDQGMRASFSLLLQDASGGVVRLRRTYVLPRQSIESGRHDVLLDMQVENLKDTPAVVTVTYHGGVGIPLEDARYDDRVVDWAVREGTAPPEGSRQTQANVAPKQEVSLFSQDDMARRLSWAATGNKYFSCTLCPVSPASTPDNPVESSTLVKAAAIDMDGDTASTDDVTVQLVSLCRLAPGEMSRLPAQIYLGEKDGEAFREVPAYRARNFYYQVEQGYGYCTFTWLVELMIWLLNTLHAAFGDFGVAIILMVLMVRALLHPITKKGQVNMVRMQQRMGEFQPKMEELKRKYGNDKARLQQETMKLYREEGVNPAGQLFTCLPMFLQLPIWFALFISLGNNIQMRHEGFLFTWINDLTGQDALYTFASPVVVPIVGWTLPSFNLLPILVAISMYVQQKLQPKPKPNPNMSEQAVAQQEMMQKMMPLMSIMMLLFFYKMPAGLNLYIMTSSLFGAIEQGYIRKHIRQHEEAGTLHKPKNKPGPGKPKNPSFWQKLVHLAEEAQKQQQQNPSGRRNRKGERGSGA